MPQQTATAPATRLPQANTRPANTPFPADQYATFANVPVFAEHETKARDGRTLRFGRRELQAVCDRCNRRIRETGDYAVTCLGHTSDPDSPVQKEPEVIGFAGPFRLGMIGQPGQRQRYAILADFHILKEDVGKFKKHPRRSPELWLEDNYDEMFLDPIALLGAEAPRLDMGLTTGAVGTDGATLYSAIYQGRRRERYTAVTCAAPGPANVHVPAHEPATKRRHYAADALTPPEPTGAATMLAPEEIKQIIDALMETDVMRWVEQEMAKGEGGNPSAPPSPGMEPPPKPDLGLPPAGGAPGAEPPLPPPGPDAGMPPPGLGDEPDGDEGGAPPPGPDAGAEPPPAPEADTPKEKMEAEAQPYAAGVGGTDIPSGSKHDIEETLKTCSEAEFNKWVTTMKAARSAAQGSSDGDHNGGQHASGSVEGSGLAKSGSAEGSTARYSALETRLRELEAERHQRTQEARRGKLEQLRYYRSFDLDKEVQRCQKLSDEQFVEHCEFISDNAQPTNVSAPFPIPDEPHQFPEAQAARKPERYTKDACDKAVKIVAERRSAGRQADYQEILEAVANGRPLPE